MLRRMGFAATPEATSRAVRQGLAATVNRGFAKIGILPKDPRLAEFDQNNEKIRAHARTLSPEERQEYFKEIRQKSGKAFNDYGMQWLDFCRQPENAAQEKLVMCLQDVFVIARQKVNSPTRLFDYQQLLRIGITGTYPDLAKAVMRSPGMIQYLDLNRSSKQAPNENFARELFELFTLGEGNYSEADIKEAARALTGISLRGEAFFFDEKRHDDGEKTIFGQTGKWKPDDVIDLAFQQDAATRFFPGELTKYYLTENGLPDEHLAALGQIWKRQRFHIRDLVRTFFCSQIFFHPQFRGNMIKSPLQYYLGLCCDLRLDISPYPGQVLNLLRTMGQPFYDPPNVRGWVGGKNWINSTTLAARRQIARSLFNPVNEEKLNADDRRALEEARAADQGRITVDDELIRFLADNRTNDEIAVFLTTYFLPQPVGENFLRALAGYIKDQPPGPRRASIRQAAIAVLQSPLYQLC